MANKSLTNPIIDTINNVTNFIPKYFEEKTKVENLKTIEAHKTNRFELETTRDNRDSEINSTKEVVIKSLDNQENITDKSLSLMGKTISKTQDNSHELTLKSMKDVSNSTDKTIDIIEKLSENNSKRTERLSEKYNLTLSEKNKEIKDYQKSLQVISEKIIEFRVQDDIRNKYMKGIEEYVTVQANYEEELSNIKNEINILEKKIKPIQGELQEIEVNLKIENRLLDKSHFVFEKSFEELENIKFEYKDSMKEDEYLKHLGRAKRKLIKDLHEISQNENILLNGEKDRLNKIEEMTPLKENLEKLKINFNLLKKSKKKFEKINMISMLNPNNNHVPSIIDKENEDIIDVTAKLKQLT